MNTPTNGETMLLTSKERERFAAYLEEEAKTDKEMAEQIENIGPAVLAKKYRVEAMAAEIIAKKLREIEDQTI